MLHPKPAPANAPLYVVLHSAGHDVHSCLACTTRVGNHDIYHSPHDFFALYLDCRATKGDWWWGIHKYPGPNVSPTEKRVIDTVNWVIEKYGLDANRDDPTAHVGLGAALEAKDRLDEAIAASGRSSA